MPAPASADAPARAEERSVDKAVLAWLESHPHATANELADVLPNEPFRVDVERAPTGPGWGKLEIDLDRDGKIDEKWWLNEGQPGKKRVSTNDDGRFDREERWRDGRWVRKRGQW